MPKRARQGANDLETELVPETSRRFVRRDDKIKLHGTEPEPARFAQAMLGHGAADSFSAGIQRDHERRVRDVRTSPTLIRPQNIGTHNVSILCCDVSVYAFTKPVGQRIFARHLRVKCIGIAVRDHRVKNFPDRIMICFFRNSNVQHGTKRNCRATVPVADLKQSGRRCACPTMRIRSCAKLIVAKTKAQSASRAKPNPSPSAT